VTAVANRWQYCGSTESVQQAALEADKLGEPLPSDRREQATYQLSDLSLKAAPTLRIMHHKF